MNGSEKQIKWANEILAKYSKITGETLTCSEAVIIIKFGGGLNNINYKGLKNALRAYEYMSDDKTDLDNMEEDVKKGLITFAQGQIVASGALNRYVESNKRW